MENLKSVSKISILCLLSIFFLMPRTNAQSLPDTITIQVPRPDNVPSLVTMKLYKYSVRDQTHCKFYRDEQDYSQVPKLNGADPARFTEITLDAVNYPVRTYRGHVVEEPNSQVIAVIWPGNNTMSAYTHEGVRYLWDIDHLPISLNMATGRAVIDSTIQNSGSYASINVKAGDENPSFDVLPLPSPSPGSGIIPSGNSHHGWKLLPSANFKKVQIAYDVEPEWFGGQDKANNDLQKMFAIMEFATNALDLQYARDLRMQFRLTGVVLRDDTDLHTILNDAVVTWVDNGLGNNPGSFNTKASSIPVQQIVYTTNDGEGNQGAGRSRQPLAGGNFTKVFVGLDENSGLQHEISHTWGGQHFVYPNDIMSGGGSWFGPATNQRHIYIREDQNISGGLPTATNQEYGWNVHPYTTPDLVTTGIGQQVIIDVIANDFDSNGDALSLVQFDVQAAKGGSVTNNNNQLAYTPAQGFIGRDSFTYTISDGQLFNTTWVQVDVNDGGLLLHYTFENGGSLLTDQSGLGFDAHTINFPVASTTSGKIGNGWEFPQLPNPTFINYNNKVNENDDARAFVSFNDVVDPLDKSHSVSIWFKMDPYSRDYQGSLPCYIVSNSSTANNHDLTSGYNIYMNKNSKEITFEVCESLDFTDPDDKGTVVEIKGNSPIQANTWYNAVLVIDRSVDSLRAYIDGAWVGTKPLKAGGMIKGKPNGDRYTSGALGVSTYKPRQCAPFVGAMDEFRVYGRSLTEAEVQALYNSPGDVLPIDNMDLSLIGDNNVPFNIQPTLTNNYLQVKNRELVVMNSTITNFNKAKWGLISISGTPYYQIINQKADGSGRFLLHMEEDTIVVDNLFQAYADRPVSQWALERVAGSNSYYIRNIGTGSYIFWDMVAGLQTGGTLEGAASWEISEILNN